MNLWHEILAFVRCTGVQYKSAALKEVLQYLCMLVPFHSFKCRMAAVAGAVAA
jgi:hypothetical protein